MCSASVILYVPKFVSLRCGYDISRKSPNFICGHQKVADRMLSYFRENWSHMRHCRACRECQYCVVSARLSVLSIDTIDVSL